MPNTQQNSSRTLGVIILTGGHSQRMGRPKWSLPFGNETLLQRTVTACCQISEEVVIAASDTQQYPDAAQLPTIIRDKQSDRGPLEGIRGGLEFLHQQGFEWGFVTACDVPNLAPQVANFLLQHSDGFEAVIPCRDDRIYGMTAIYKCKFHTRIESLIEKRKLRVSQLAELFYSRMLPAESIRSVDKDLDSLTNLNYPEQYLAALNKLKLDPPTGFSESTRN